MTIVEAVNIFYSGKLLKFGDPKHIEAKNILKRLKKKTPNYKIFLITKQHYVTTPCE
jgi:hypothetical protein